MMRGDLSVFGYHLWFLGEAGPTAAVLVELFGAHTRALSPEHRAQVENFKIR